MKLERYFPEGVPSTTSGRDALLRVRVSDDLESSGYVAVYSATGTQLIVRRSELLRLEQPEA